MQYANQLLQPFMNWDFNFFGDLKVSDDTSWNFFEAGRTISQQSISGGTQPLHG